MKKNVPGYYLQCRLLVFFSRVVGNNVEKCSNFSSCVFFRIVTHNADHFSALWTSTRKNFRRCCLHCGKIIGIVGNNVEKCLNSSISTNSKPYANLHFDFRQEPWLMCFMKKRWGEKSRGTVPLNRRCTSRASLHHSATFPLIFLQKARDLLTYLRCINGNCLLLYYHCTIVSRSHCFTIPELPHCPTATASLQYYLTAPLPRLIF
jgi:hypothetical protein